MQRGRFRNIIRPSTHINFQFQREPAPDEFLIPFSKTSFPDLIKYYCDDRRFLDWCRKRNLPYNYLRVFKFLAGIAGAVVTRNDLIHAYFKFDRPFVNSEVDYFLQQFYCNTIVMTSKDVLDENHVTCIKFIPADQRYNIIKQYFINDPTLLEEMLPSNAARPVASFIDGWYAYFTTLSSYIYNWAWARARVPYNYNPSTYKADVQAIALYDMAAAGWFE